MRTPSSKSSLRWLSAAFCSALAFATPAFGDARSDALARRLVSDHLYVSPSLIRETPADEVAALRRDMTAAKFPVYIAVLPTFGIEESFTVASRLPPLLHDRIDTPGVYIAVDADSFVNADAYGVDVPVDLGAFSSQIYRDHPGDDPIQAVRYALRRLQGAPRHHVPDPDRDRHRSGVRVAITWGFGVAVFLAVCFGLGRPRRRPHAVKAALDGDMLTRQARGDLSGLATALDRASHPPDAAFRASEAASKALDDARRPIDALGALVLARRGLRAVRGQNRTDCFFDPRHTGKVTMTNWRLGHREAELPACRACARRIARGETPEAVEDRGRPYYERDTVWARTGFGTLDPDLADHVLAGEVHR